MVCNLETAGEWRACFCGASSGEVYISWHSELVVVTTISAEGYMLATSLGQSEW